MKESEDGIDTEEHIIRIPKYETVIYETETLLVLGLILDVKRFIEFND
jgi:hypothetical protein